MQVLRRHGVQPATIIDVGVGRRGTPWLYEAFPQARLVLVDPNPALRRTMAALADTWGAKMIAAAAGAAHGMATMYVDEDARSSSSLLTASTVLNEARGARVTSSHEVPVRTLDWIVEDAGAQPPYLLKLDTEGYELEALRGASCMLPHTEAVIAEASVVKRFEGSYEFADLVTFLDRHGFRLFDFVEVTTLGQDGPINFLDAVFVRRAREVRPPTSARKSAEE